jgi:hypothetical protein
VFEGVRFGGCAEDESGRLDAGRGFEGEAVQEGAEALDTTGGEGGDDRRSGGCRLGVGHGSLLRGSRLRGLRLRALPGGVVRFGVEGGRMPCADIRMRKSRLVHEVSEQPRCGMSRSGCGSHAICWV